MTTSPSVNNLTILTGVVSFKRDGESDWRDLGEVAQFQLATNNEKLAYFSKRSGIRSKVKEIITAKAATITFQMNEVTGANMADAMGGTLITNTDGTKTFGFMENNTVEGDLRIVGSSEVGNKVSWEGTVSLSPSGSFDMLGDDWAVIEVSAEVFADVDGAFGVFDIDDGEASD